jgi:hypothetical protein
MSATATVTGNTLTLTVDGVVRVTTTGKRAAAATYVAYQIADGFYNGCGFATTSQTDPIKAAKSLTTGSSYPERWTIVPVSR